MIQTTLQHCLSTLSPQASIYIAYSGGVDSHVLLHAIAAVRADFPALQIKALHINHQLSPHAEAWTQHCKKICAALTVPLIIEYVDAKAQTGDSPEAAARSARYQAFAKILQAGEYLLVAQHEDDQAETILLQLMRGAGPKGLSAMAENTVMSYHLLRPLLKTNKAAILAYAEQHQLIWINDESNQDTRFERNFIRHEILPRLKTRRAGVVSAMSRSALLCAEASELLDELAALDLKQVVLDEKSLSAKKLQQLSTARLKNILRYWLQKQNIILPSQIKLEHIVSDVVFSRYEARPVVEWGGVEMRREKDVIITLRSK